MCERKDLFIIDPTGTGKSYLATALGDKACQEGFRVMYTSTAKLVSQLKIAKAKGTILTELKRLELADLLILDELASLSSFAPRLSFMQARLHARLGVGLACRRSTHMAGAS